MDDDMKSRLTDIVACMSAAPQPWRDDLQYLYGLVDKITQQVLDRDIQIRDIQYLNDGLKDNNQKWLSMFQQGMRMMGLVSEEGAIDV